MRAALYVAFVLLCPARVAMAQAPDATGVCVANCGGSSSSAGTDPQTAAAIAAERAERARIDRENAARMSVERRIHTIRTANSAGVAAYNKKQWAAAIRQFEKVLAMNPEDPYARANLEAAQRAENDEQGRLERERAAKQRASELETYRRAHAAEQKRLAKLLANGPVVPSPGSAPTISLEARLSDDLPPLLPDAHALIGFALDAAGDRAKDEALGRLDDLIDVMTPQGLYLRVQMNTTKLATDTIPNILMNAARGNIEPGDPLELKATTVIFNVGGAPGEMAEKIVKVGSVGKVVLDEAEQRTTRLLERGITSLAFGLGASATGAGARFHADAHALLARAKQAQGLLVRWTQPGSAR